MNKLIIAALVAGSFLAVSCGPEKIHDVQTPNPKVDALFQEWDTPDSPGCALAVIKDGAIIYTRGYGMADLEHKIPNAPETVFYIGSESKQFAAMAILLLEEEGKLSLDDDIRKFLPEIPDYGRTITIRHLILHTSGLRDYFILWDLSGLDYANNFTNEEVIALIARQKELNFMPGDERLYSNTGYLLLAEIVKRTSGLSLAEYASKNIFAPLGMTHTHFHDDPSLLIANRAWGHLKRPDGSWGLMAFRFSLVGSGGLYTTVRDLALWDANFYDNRLGTGGQALIDRMITPGKLNSGEKLSYACALAVGEYRGLKTVRHGGALGGYRAHMLRFPDEKFTVIVLFNTGNVDPAGYAEKTADIFLADTLGPATVTAEPVTVEEKKTEPFAPSTTQLAAYVGEYESGELLVRYRVIDDNGALSVVIRDAVTRPLKPLEKDVFSMNDAVIRFTRGRSGAVDGLTVEAGRVKNLRFARITR